MRFIRMTKTAHPYWKDDMSLIKWKDEFSVSVQLLDVQHKKLIEALNDLYTAMRDGKGLHIAPDILTKLVAYAGEHFDGEEKLLLQTNYPKYGIHKAEHEKFSAEIKKMIQQIEAGQIANSVKLLDFLQTWLQTHILTIDKQYSSHLQAAGIY